MGSGHGYIPKKKELYITYLRKAIVKSFEGPPETSSVRLTAIFSFKWRVKDKQYKVLEWIPMFQRPDIDNLLKPLKDAMEKVCYVDDSQIVEIRARKIRSDREGIYVMLDAVKPRRKVSSENAPHQKNT